MIDQVNHSETLICW